MSVLALSVSATALGVTSAADTAYAQAVCITHVDETDTDHTPQGNPSGGVTATACGNGAVASAKNSTAVGSKALASQVGATAVGALSTASGELSTAVGFGSKATGTKSAAFGLNSVAAKGGATAVGPGAAALNGSSAAFGSLTKAEGLGSVAIGGDIDGPDGETNKGAQATGDRSIAIGGDSQALGESAIAIGTGSNATHSNSAAFGSGATATRADQQVFGTATNTYTMPGITSGASKAAQGAPTHIVTTNPSGDLAAHTIGELGLATQGDVANLQDRIDGLGRRDKELADGIAIALALAQPIFQPGQTFAVRAGWGNFEGSNAVGVTAAGLVGRGYWGPTSSVVVDAGIGTGTSEGVVAGRAGLTFGW